MKAKYIKYIMLYLFLAALLGSGTAASAHSYSVAFTRINQLPAETTIEYAIDDLSLIESIPGIDSDKNFYLSTDELARGEAEVADWLRTHLIIHFNGQAQDFKEIEISLHTELPFKDGFKYGENFVYEDYFGPDTKIVMAVITLGAFKPQDTVLIEDRFQDTVPGTYGNFVNILSSGQLKTTTVLFDTASSYSFRLSPDHTDQGADQDQPSPAQTATAATAQVDWLAFLKLGSMHILTGIDHLLFLFTLVLLTMKVREYAKIITSFTVAHSLTLALSVLGIFTLPSKFVEAAIALSIMYVAMENLFLPGNARFRWLLTFAFGLIHGMGFADLLMKMHLPRSQLVKSLLSFNLGIELTQLSLVLLLLPLLWYWQRRTRWYAASFKWLNIAAALVSLVWVIQRVFL